MLREVTATRYVAPLRAGGSLPGLVEADDLGTYVVKFTGSAQGRKALVAEVIVGELARALGLRFPELVLVRFDPAVAAHEPHQEVQDLLHASAGLNLGMDYLPGARDFTPEVAAAFDVDPLEAGRIIWLDALTVNVDRTTHSSNLMIWPTLGVAPPKLWLIDHGAALVFHHRWDASSPTRWSCHMRSTPSPARPRCRPSSSACGCSPRARWRGCRSRATRSRSRWPTAGWCMPGRS